MSMEVRASIGRERERREEHERRLAPKHLRGPGVSEFLEVHARSRFILRLVSFGREFRAICGVIEVHPQLRRPHIEEVAGRHDEFAWIHSRTRRAAVPDGSSERVAELSYWDLGERRLEQRGRSIIEIHRD